MPSTKTIEDKELGEIKLRKYKGAKYLRIKIDERGQVAISMPYFTRFDEGLAFLEEKRNWVKEQKTKHQEELKKRSEPIDEFRTKFRELELIPCDISKATYRLSPTKIKIYYPSKLDCFVANAPRNDDRNNTARNDTIQPIIKTAVEAALRREAHNYLPRRLKELAEKHGLKYKKLSIRNTRTRWGSCTHENNINLCMHLMKLPDELIDYVLLHELAHTVEKNHSASFWNLLSQMLGQNAKIIDKKLKAYRPNVELG